MIQYPAIFHKISEMSVVYNVIFMILIFISNTEKNWLFTSGINEI